MANEAFSVIDSVDVEHARTVLTTCLRFFRERAEESSYGYPCSEDPRDFSPDYEVCTPEEIEAHKQACAAWERGERPEAPRRKIVTAEEARAMFDRGEADSGIINPTTGVAAVHPSGWGMGTTTFADEDMRDMAEQCEAALARIGGEADAE